MDTGGARPTNPAQPAEPYKKAQINVLSQDPETARVSEVGTAAQFADFTKIRRSADRLVNS